MAWKTLSLRPRTLSVRGPPTPAELCRPRQGQCAASLIRHPVSRQFYFGTGERFQALGKSRGGELSAMQITLSPQPLPGTLFPPILIAAWSRIAQSQRPSLLLKVS